MLISFDIGIKNMAYCIFSYDGSGLSISDWNILNLMEQSSLPKHHCTCVVGKPKKRNRVVPDVICGRNAKYRKSDTFYCETHAKSTGDYMIPKKIWSSKSLQKLKVDDVKKIYHEFIPVVDDAVNPKLTKKQMIDSLLVFFQERCYDPIVPTKDKTASETDLITIGRNMKTAMDRIDLSHCTHAILENQISPIASRMKTVQGMLAQYFIMKCPESLCIEFVSSSNKLKIGVRPETPVESGEPTNAAYKQHKLDAVYYCRKILEKNKALSADWTHILESKKRDDLADCFLQGIWYLRNQKKITVTDDFLVQPI